MPDADKVTATGTEEVDAAIGEDPLAGAAVGTDGEDKALAAGAEACPPPPHPDKKLTVVNEYITLKNSHLCIKHQSIKCKKIHVNPTSAITSDRAMPEGGRQV
jgi:hypothetical protein